MKKKKTKINWKNILKTILFIFCIYMILHDLFMITIYGWINGNQYRFSWFGFITFILFFITAIFIYEDFEEQTKSVPVTRNNRYTNK